MNQILRLTYWLSLCKNQRMSHALPSTKSICLRIWIYFITHSICGKVFDVSVLVRYWMKHGETRHSLVNLQDKRRWFGKRRERHKKVQTLDLWQTLQQLQKHLFPLFVCSQKTINGKGHSKVSPVLRNSIQSVPGPLLFSEFWSQHSCLPGNFKALLSLSADQLYQNAFFISLQDLAPAHAAKRTKGWFHDSNITGIDWSADSPDLDPVENLGSTV